MDLRNKMTGIYILICYFIYIILGFAYAKHENVKAAAEKLIEDVCASVKKYHWFLLV